MRLSVKRGIKKVKTFLSFWFENITAKYANI